MIKHTPPKIDAASAWLLEQLRTADTSLHKLWLADENTLTLAGDNAAQKSNLRVITNRFDVAHTLRQQSFEVQLSDFDFSAIEDCSLELVYYRISKEKPVVYHLFNESFAKLKVGGRLLICGKKNEGIKTYFSKLKKIWKGDSLLEKQGDNYVGYLVKGCDQASEIFDTKDYYALRQVNETPSCQGSSTLKIHSKPGLFGWNKIDQGSAFLCEHLQALIDSRKTPCESVLDLGCGYGYLSLMLKDSAIARRVATDNNAAAVQAASENFKHNQMEVEVFLDDCASNIDERFDLIVCNPPFHQGFSIDGDLSDKFLRNARAHMKTGACALFVVNQFIPLERKAGEHFSKISQVANNGSFKLVLLET